MGVAHQTQGQIQEFLTVLYRRRWQIFLPALFVLALGSVYAVIVPKRFVLTTEVEVREGPRVGLEEAVGPRSYTAIREISNVAAHLKQYLRVRRIIEQEGALWDEYVKLEEREKVDYIDRVLARVTVSQRQKAGQEGSEFVVVTYEDVDAHRGEAFLRDLVDDWIAMVIDRDAEMLEAEIEDLQDQVDSARTQHVESSRQYTALAKAMGIDPNEPLYDPRTRGRDPLIDRRDGLMTRSTNLAASIEAAQAAFDQAESDLEATPATIPEPVLLAGQDYQQQIAAAEQQILNLRQTQARLKPAHSQFKRIEEEIAGLQEGIRTLKALTKEADIRAVDQPNPALPARQDAVREARTALATLIRERESVDLQVQALDIEVENRIGQIAELQLLQEDRQRKAVLRDQKERELAHKQGLLTSLDNTYRFAEDRPYQVVRPAVASDEPEKPNPWLIVVFSLVGGLALGMSISLGAEYARNSYRAVSDVAAVMAVPVLGSINTIVTTAEARRTQARRAFVGLSTAMLLGGLAWFTWIWAYSPERLPTEIRQAIDDLRRLLM
ncbi:MAG: hypothetical protein AB1726_06950 [Planctomycetota bacterium]